MGWITSSSKMSVLQSNPISSKCDCYSLNVFASSPPNSCWNLIHNVMVCWGGAFWWWLSQEGGTLIAGISVLIKGAPESSLSPWTGVWILTIQQIYQRLDLGQILSKPPQPWYFFFLVYVLFPWRLCLVFDYSPCSIWPFILSILCSFEFWMWLQIFCWSRN